MVQTRYERLKTKSGHEEHLQQRWHNYTSTYSDHSNDDKNDVELDIEYRLGENQQKGHISNNDNGHTTTTTTITHEKISSSKFMQMAIGTVATILLYLSLSICLTFYQKALIKELKFPLAIVFYHLLIKYILSVLVRTFYKCHAGKARVQLDWRTAIRKIAPTGIASGIDISFSNWGLELVPISLYTMTKSSTIVFILFFAILLGLEKKSWSLVFIVVLIAIGLFMFTYKSTQFDALGFIFILLASLSSGVRWSFAQFVMQKAKVGLHHPVDMIYHMQPWMILPVLPFLIAFEGERLYDVLRQLATFSHSIVYMTTMKVSIGAVLAFLMEVSEFLVLSKTSSLTLSIAGIFKDICQLALAVKLNGDEMSIMNVFGLVVCLAGICCHLAHKYSALMRSDDLEHCSDNEDSQYNESTINAVTATPNASSYNAPTVSYQKKHSAQSVPLLEHTDDSDDSFHGDDNVNATEIIFDVLKRRDMSR